MPRMSGVSKKVSDIRKKIARGKKIPQSAVRPTIVKKRLGTKDIYRGEHIFPGIKVRLKPGETARDALRRAKKYGQKSGKN